MNQNRAKAILSVVGLILLLAAVGQVVFSQMLEKDAAMDNSKYKMKTKGRIALGANLSPDIYPIRDWSVPPVDIEAKSFLVYDVRRNTILAEKKINQPLPMASITKLMTAFTAFKSGIDLSTKVRVPEDIRSLPLSPVLKVQSRLSMENILKAMLSASVNEAAYILASSQAEGGTFTERVDNFVKKMNENAAQLGLKHTHFANPAGFDQNNHYTTCSNLLTLIKEIIDRYPQIFAYTIQDKVVVPGVGANIRLSNTNTLLSDFNVWGQKTGYTKKAQGGMVLIEANQFGKIIYILLGTKHRAEGMTKLIKWTHRAYRFPRT